jgi:hypothetical protein
MLVTMPMKRSGIMVFIQNWTTVSMMPAVAAV